MTDDEIVANAAIRSKYGTLVAYTGAGLDGDMIVAIRSDTDAAMLQGYDGSPARVTFEIERSQLPQDARKGHRIVEQSGAAWSVIDPDFRQGIDSWVLGVERSAT